MGLTVREILTFKSIYPQQNRGTRSSGIPNTPQSTVLENHLENVQQRYIRNQVVKKWPGNNLPTFNKDDTDNKKELEELVTKLSENPLLKSVVEADKVKSKVIQIMKERRRNVRKGMDYKVDVVNSSGKTSTDGVDMTISKEVGKRKNQTTLIGTSSKKLRTSSSDKVKTQDSKKKMSPKTSTRIDTPSEESVRENPFTRSLGLFSPVEDSQQCSQQIENSQQTEESPFRLPWDTPVKIKNKEDAKEKINESGIHIGPLETDTDRRLVEIEDSEDFTEEFSVADFDAVEFMNIAKTYCGVQEFSTRNDLLKYSLKAGMLGGIGGRATMDQGIETFGRWLFVNKKVMVLHKPVENALDMVKIVPKTK